MLFNSATVVKFKSSTSGNKKLVEQSKRQDVLQQISNQVYQQQKYISNKKHQSLNFTPNHNYKSFQKENFISTNTDKAKDLVSIPSRQQVLLYKIKQRRVNINHKNHQSQIQLHKVMEADQQQKLHFRQNRERKSSNIETHQLFQKIYEKPSTAVNKDLQNFLIRCKSFSCNNKVMLKKNEQLLLMKLNKNQQDHCSIPEIRQQLHKIQENNKKIEEFITVIQQLQNREQLLISELRLSAFKNIQNSEKISLLIEQNEHLKSIIISVQKKNQKMTDSYCYSEESNQSQRKTQKSSALLGQIQTICHQNQKHLYSDYKGFSSEISTLAQGQFLEKLIVNKLPTQSSPRSSFNQLMKLCIQNQKLSIQKLCLQNQKLCIQIEKYRKTQEQLEQELEQKHNKTEFYQQQIMHLKDCIDKSKINTKSLLSQIRNLTLQKKQLEDRLSILSEQFYQYKLKIQQQTKNRTKSKIIGLPLEIIPSETEISYENNQIMATNAEWFQIVCDIFDINCQQQFSKQTLMKKVINYQNKLITTTQKLCMLQQKMSLLEKQQQHLLTENRKFTKKYSLESQQMLGKKYSSFQVPFVNFPLNKNNSNDYTNIDNSF